MTRLIAVLAFALACTPALAQKKTYRCGNQYQERPCEGPKTDAAADAAKADPQKQQESAAKREQALHLAKCENYAEELGDIDRRIKAGAEDRVMDQFMRRQKEMKIRIDRECK